MLTLQNELGADLSAQEFHMVILYASEGTDLSRGEAGGWHIYGNLHRSPAWSYAAHRQDGRPINECCEPGGRLGRAGLTISRAVHGRICVSVVLGGVDDRRDVGGRRKLGV